jgi:hypothetical protein
MPAQLPGDPYRILGLPRGAPLADVKRAYRRLAKEHHPDSAGPAAVRRFIAIQAAYEAIERSAGSGGAPPGAGPTAERRGTPRGTADEQSQRARRGRRTGAAPGPAAGARRDGDTTGRRDPSTGTTGRRKATPGSTTYDDADDREPAWYGSTWYGPASGTYWTVNPREYADPRKHGPEYQERARRALADERAWEDPAPRTGTGSTEAAAAPGEPAAIRRPDDVRGRIADAVARVTRRPREPRVR